MMADAIRYQNVSSPKATTLRRPDLKLKLRNVATNTSTIQHCECRLFPNHLQQSLTLFLAPSHRKMSSAEGDPKPPVKYAHAAPEGEELKQWKTSVLAMIDKRIDLYPRPFPRNGRIRATRAVLLLFVRIRQLWRNLLRIWPGKLASASWTVDVEQDQRPVSLDPDRVVTAIEKAGHVPELVENIIRFADAETQIHVAWNVSALWRHTVAHVMANSNSFRPSHPYEVVELGSKRNLAAMSGLPEPSNQEFQKFERELQLLRGLYEPLEVSPHNHWSGIYPPYWPARICASKTLSDRIKDLYHEHDRYSTCLETDELHDFTQLKMNPYLQTVFSRQLTESTGVYEFKLQSLSVSTSLIHGIPPLIYGVNPYRRTFVDLMGSMQLTQPPCKAIELCVQIPFQSPDSQPKHPISFRNSTHTAIHVLNENGVTCAQLFDALEESAKRVMEHWELCARKFRENVLELEEYTDGIWVLRGTQTVHIVLSDSERCEKKWNWGSMQVSLIVDRQLEWIPMELVRTMEHVEFRDGRVCRNPADLER